MNSHPVSAVLTTYQRPELARRALNSILNQSVTPAEIIVVEDAGETDLRDWLSDLGRDDILYVRHDSNRGLAAARNTGLKLASCDLIAFLDDDDQWRPTRLQEQVEHLKSLPDARKHRLASIQVGCLVVDGEGKSIAEVLPINQGNLKESIIENGASTPSSCFMFMRPALMDVGGFDEDLASGIDHDIWMKLAVAGYSNEIIRKPLVVVTRDSRPTMMSDTPQRIAGISQFVEKWTPTYREWLGVSRGDAYARKYFINVVCRLAAQKLSTRNYREGALAARAALQRAGRRPGLFFYGVTRLMRTYLAMAIKA
jgi:glycosyltransferase involved in cell wall biosynthesis